MPPAELATPTAAGDDVEAWDDDDESLADRLVTGIADRDLVTYTRSPIALARLLGGLLAAAVVAGAIRFLPDAHRGLEADMARHTGTWGGSAARLADAVAATSGLLVLAGALAAARVSRRHRHAATVLLAAAAAAALVTVAARQGGLSPGAIVAEEWALVAAVTGIAVITASFSVLSSVVARWATAMIVIGVTVGSIGATVSPGIRVLGLLAGVCVGAAGALVAGTPSQPLTRAALAAALGRARLAVSSIEPHSADARGSMPWLAELATGRKVFVKVAAREHWAADVLFRTWRRLRLRDVDDERPGGSVRRAIEHEAFVARRASEVGVRTPEMIGVGMLGDDGAFAVFDALAAPTMADLGGDITDSTLRGAWSQVRTLHRAGIAHRDLRAANLLVDDDGNPWIIDFGFAELAAEDRSLTTDVVELLASTAPLVGTERAVDAAVSVLGEQRLGEVLGWVQPLAVSSATRAALGRAGFAELRDALRLKLGVGEPDIPQLARVRPTTVLAVLGLGVALWTLLPQVADDIDWSSVWRADPVWFGVALVASAATYVGAALSLRAAASDSVPVGGALLAQLASSFTNRVTPAKVGGMALNIRYLVKQGLDTGSAATAVAVSTVAGAAVHVVLSVVALLWVGDMGGIELTVPSGRTLGVTGAIAGAVIGATFLVPPLRSWLSGSVVPSLRRSWRSFLEVVRQPSRLATLGSGSLVVTLGNIAALTAALAAFGERPPVATIAAVYLAGSAVASAAPTPGGLGATEAALVAGLSLTGTAEQVAVPAVLVFRAATFWLPILPGWLSFVHLQRRDQL